MSPARIVQPPTQEILQRLGTGPANTVPHRQEPRQPGAGTGPGQAGAIFSSSGSSLPLPNEVSGKILGNGAVRGCENFGLLFQRFIHYPAGQNWTWKEAKGKGNTWDHLTRQADTIFTARCSRELVQALAERWQRLEKGLANSRRFETTVSWRLAIGLGIEHSLENGITLHRVYGVPYLPGSAIKGLTRWWCLETLAEELGVEPVPDQETLKQLHQKKKKSGWELMEEILFAEPPRNEKEQERLQRLYQELAGKAPGVAAQTSTFEELQEMGQPLRAVFGSQDRRGQVGFLDAFPAALASGPRGILEQDIVNVHYQPYYSDHPEPPADYLDPVPCQFLVVRGGTCFVFLLHGREPDLVQQAAEWCREALKERGIGAKTAAGYGALD